MKFKRILFYNKLFKSYVVELTNGLFAEIAVGDNYSCWLEPYIFSIVRTDDYVPQYSIEEKLIKNINEILDKVLEEQGNNIYISPLAISYLNDEKERKQFKPGNKKFLKQYNILRLLNNKKRLNSVINI